VATSEEMVIARPEQEQELAATARLRLRMLVVGAAYWRPADEAEARRSVRDGNA
jgi:hypothetical protein